MTAFATNQVGNWGTTTIWTPNGTPGDGDTVTISHDVDTDGNRTIGTSPVEESGTPAILVDGSAELTIGDGDVLTLRGDGACDYGRLQMDAGAVLEFDASQAATPGDQNYMWELSKDNNATLTGINIDGTGGSRCTVRSNAGGGTGYITFGALRTYLNATFCDFEDINNPANDRAISTYLVDSITSTQETIYEDCTWDAGCGAVRQGTALPANSVMAFRRCNHLGEQGTYSIRMNGTNAVGTGTREIDDCYFHLKCDLGVAGLTIKGTLSGCVFKDGMLTGTATDFAVFQDSLVIEGTTIWQSSERIYMYNTELNNPHWLNLNDFNHATFTLTDFTFELAGNWNTDLGDCILAGNAPATLNIVRPIVLPQDDGNAPGTLLTCAGDATQTIHITHPTVVVYTSRGITVGETYNSHTGQIGTMKSGIYWGTGTNQGAAIANINGAPNDNVVAAADADYNDTFNLAADPYDLPLDPDTPGANDFDVDPDFVDETRDMAAWDDSLGGAGTRANALVELAKMHLPTWDSNYTPKALTTWVRDGFQVQEATLEDAGHDSVTVGAMNFLAATSAAILIYTKKRRAA